VVLAPAGVSIHPVGQIVVVVQSPGSLHHALLVATHSVRGPQPLGQMVVVVQSLTSLHHADLVGPQVLEVVVMVGVVVVM
jgi:hypothetical protein